MIARFWCYIWGHAPTHYIGGLEYVRVKCRDCGHTWRSYPKYKETKAHE